MELSTEALAAELLAAYDAGRLTARPSDHGQFALAQAYAVGARLTELRRARGERTVGRKIGFTNRSLWEPYGVDRPLWAHVYDGTLTMAVGGAARLRVGHMVAPRIETEVVLGLAADVPPGAGLDEVAAAVSWVAIGFEVVDCHYPDWQFTIADCAADFGLHAALVVGEQRPVPPAERAGLAALLPDVRVELSRGGELAAAGIGANALGSPLLALQFLAETLAAQGGEPLRAGEVVTTGTLPPALPTGPGERWRAESFSPLGLGALELELVA